LPVAGGGGPSGRNKDSVPTELAAWPILEAYAEAALNHYQNDTVYDVTAAFCEDFLYWDASHFRKIKKSTCVTLRDLLRSKGAKVIVNSKHTASKNLGSYMNMMWIKCNDDVQQEGIEVNTVQDGVELSTVEVENPVRNLTTRTNDGGEQPAEEDQVGDVAASNHELFDRERDMTRRNGPSRPTDVSKLFSRDLKYGGAPTEPLRRRFQLFLNACALFNVGTEDDTMLVLFEAVFLTGQALLHFQDVIRNTATCVEEAVDLLEAHFLGHRAKRVNDEI